MVQFLVTWLVSAASVLLTVWLIPGLSMAGLSSALIAAPVFGIVNAVVKPILVLFTLPLTVLSLGLFLLVVNAIAFALVGDLTPGFVVAGFFPALFGSLALSFISSLLNSLLQSDDETAITSR